eukprot:TRINITY_DN484_c0_g1_i1.p1 TRINITY_DN484_c0_g1~~TRINITY_DN484_c0_g1_i1.p1  ORF type:complete len:557 (-),score=116.63 TRINITY_DN484_c0_g1_i1:81-1751(-)
MCIRDRYQRRVRGEREGRMNKGVLVVVVFLGLVAACVGSAPPNRPLPPNAGTFASQYQVELLYQIDYFDTREPIRMVYDAVNNRQRIEFYNGMDTYIYLYDQNITYTIFPEVDHLVCEQMPLEYADFQSLTPFFPNISSWTYEGWDSKHDVECFKWKMETVNYNVTGVYEFYVDQYFLNPIEYKMDGVNVIFDSHPDHYRFYFLSYIPNYDNASEWDIPDICQNARMATTRRESQSSSVMNHMKNSLETAEFTEFVHKHGKTYSTPEEFDYRFSIYKDNKAFIEEHNRKNLSYKLKMNHFGDMHIDEFRSIMLPKAQRPASNLIEPIRTHTDESVDSLPPAVDWRNYNAVSKVKDQGSCGSCWTFGTTGTIEGAWALSTGSLVTLSEQQIVDCAWGYYAQGCAGGFTSFALQWIINNDGIATEDQYPYLAQDGYCNATDHSSNVTISGYVNVTATEDALQNAVGTVGPVAIAIDASLETFRFYSSGIYDDPNCQNGLDDLDHEVLAIGYGVDANNRPYWLVKNSWSTYWGDNGYIYMARNASNLCGVASEANYAIV